MTEWRVLIGKGATGPATGLRTAGELLVLAIWTIVVYRPYVTLDAQIMPAGRELFMAAQTHFIWDRLRECGLCAMWNGAVQGGYPAFADLHGAMLHPAVVISSLAFGALNGMKVALLLTFFSAGLAQWWIARVLGLGAIARIWTGAIAVAAGNVAAHPQPRRVDSEHRRALLLNPPPRIAHVVDDIRQLRLRSKAVIDRHDDASGLQQRLEERCAWRGP